MNLLNGCSPSNYISGKRRSLKIKRSQWSAEEKNGRSQPRLYLGCASNAAGSRVAFFFLLLLGAGESQSCC